MPEICNFGISPSTAFALKRREKRDRNRLYDYQEMSCLFGHPPQNQHMNQKYTEELLRSPLGELPSEVPLIYENDYTLPILIAIGGGVFLIVAGVCFWESKD